MFIGPFDWIGWRKIRAQKRLAVVYLCAFLYRYKMLNLDEAGGQKDRETDRQISFKIAQQFYREKL